MKSDNVFRYTLFLVTIILFAGKNVKAQQQNLSISLSHPVTIGDKFFSNYSGLAGVDLEYSHPISNIFMIGGKIGYSQSKYDLNIILTENPPTVSTFTNYSNLFKGQVIISSPIFLDERLFLAPQLGVGYAIIDFKGDVLRVPDDSGINTSFSLSLELLFNDQFNMGIFSSYEFIYLGKSKMHSINCGAKLTYMLN